MQSNLFSSEHTALNLLGAEVTYTQAFIENQQNYFEILKNEIQWQRDVIQIAGKTVPIPRLNAWYGDKGASYCYSGISLTPLAWTPTLLQLKTRIEHETTEPFNSVLLNYYRDGNDSVAWHSDDEAQLGTKPLIASLSFGATRRFSLRGPVALCRQGSSDLHSTNTLHIDLEGGSLLVMGGQTQQYWRHQIAKTKKTVGPRINLTFRRIVS